MSLLKRSFAFGLAFEVLLFCILMIGYKTSHGDVPNSLVIAVLCVHYPVTWIAIYLVPYPINMLVIVLLAVLAWTGLFYFVLSLVDKLFRKI